MKKGFRLFTTLSLLILYFVTIVSLFTQHGNEASVSMTVHKVAGILLLVGSLIHLAHHDKWLKIVVFHPAAGLNRKRQHQKRSMLFMLICLLICGISGVLTLGTLETSMFVTRLHSISGFILIFSMAMHLFHRRGWLIKELRRSMRSQQEDTLPVIYYKNAKES